MVTSYSDNTTAAQFVVHKNNELFSGKGSDSSGSSVITFVYNKEAAQKVVIDEITYTIPSNSILPLVANQRFEFEHPENLTAWQFNREFYCIIDHDAEVGCAGFLFYGIHHPIFITLSAEEAEEISHIEKMVASEMLIRDNFQGEMLRTLIKRLIIKATRIAKLQSEAYRQFPDDRMDIVRKFSLLLEEHFKKEHKVGFYANALNKSSKTLSNTFALLKQSPPSVLIRNRLVLEAKRYLYYTDKSAKEIAYELGFESPAHFSRFFKQYAGTNISTFKSH